MSVQVEIDHAADAAYVRLSGGSVDRTVSVSDDVNVDLDRLGVAVGIEMLHLGAELPFTTLVTDFHVHSDVVETLRQLRPSIQGFVIRLAGDGSSAAVLSQLVDA